ncbi:MAG TPA: hypothetical protein VM285_10630 [Polyangia bacterium]|nr:hypothetical protein [Polyangia bacterium]
MRRFHTAAVPFVIAVAFGCASKTTSFYMEVRPGVDDYVTVVCAPPGNPLGFSIEFPRCYCNGGIRLTYFAKPVLVGDGHVTRFEVRRGYLVEGGMKTVFVSRDGRTIDRMTVGKNRISRKDDPGIWQENFRSFTELMETFGTRLYDVEALCRAKQGGNLPLTMDLRLASPPVPR